MSEQVRSDSSRMLADRRVCERYDVVPRTLARWDANAELSFPKPVVINGRKYRIESELDAWDRQQAAKGRAA